MPCGPAVFVGRRVHRKIRDVCDREEVPGLTLSDQYAALLVPCRILPSVFLGGLIYWVP